MSFEQLLGRLEQLAAETPSGDVAGDTGGAGGGQLLKSFTLMLDDGTEVEAQDGAQAIELLLGRQDKSEQAMTKSLGAVASALEGQAKLIKSLQEQVAALGGRGTGRRAVVSVAELPAQHAGGTNSAMAGPQLMAKALDMQRAGKLSVGDVAYLDTFVSRGMAPPDELIERLQG